MATYKTERLSLRNPLLLLQQSLYEIHSMITENDDTETLSSDDLEILIKEDPVFHEKINHVTVDENGKCEFNMDDDTL